MVEVANALSRAAPGERASAWVRALAPVVFALAASLSAMTAVDLVAWRRSFPAWFVPLFAAGVAVLVACSGVVTVQVATRARAGAAVPPLVSAVVWLLMPLSFVCTTAVHGFHPFRPLPPGVFAALDPVLKLNFVLAVAGFALSVVLAALYAAGRRSTALAGLLVVALALLVPNDSCRNPFNAWWLERLGASPLMYLPNLYASLFAVSALCGVLPRLSLLALAATCGAVLLLGLGHMTGVVW